MLFEYLPEKIYRGSLEMREIEAAIDEELSLFLKARDDLLRQVILARASWGLSRFEREYGIYPDGEKTDDERRAAIQAKKRGRGTITIPVLHKVAQSFSEEPPKITAYPKEYRIEVRTDHFSIGREKDLLRILSEMIPAHIAFTHTETVKAPGALPVASYGRNGLRLTVLPYIAERQHETVRIASIPAMRIGTRIRVHPKEETK